MAACSGPSASNVPSKGKPKEHVKVETTLRQEVRHMTVRELRLKVQDLLRSLGEDLGNN